MLAREVFTVLFFVLLTTLLICPVSAELNSPSMSKTDRRIEGGESKKPMSAQGSKIVEEEFQTDPHPRNYSKDSLEILNPQSYPYLGGRWNVKFETSGTADLKITPVDTTWREGIKGGEDRDLLFKSLECGGKELDYKWVDRSSQGSAVLIENYSCNGTGMETSQVFTRGKHALQFQFGEETALAENLVTLHWSQYTAADFDSGSFSNTERQNSGGDAYIRLQSSGSSGTWSNSKNLDGPMNIVGMDVWNTQSSCTIQATLEEANNGGSVTRTLSGGRPDSFSGFNLRDNSVRVVISFGSSCSSTEVVDGIEVHLEGSNTCTIDDMDVEIRAPDDSTTSGWIDASQDSSSGTCGSTPTTTETWAKDYHYCPQNGSYDIRTRSYAEINESTSSFIWETSGYYMDLYSCLGSNVLASIEEPRLKLEPDYSTLDLQIEEEETLKLVIENPLDLRDTIDLTLSESSGDSLINWGELSGYNVSCSDNSHCEIELGPGKSTEAILDIKATKVGSGSTFYLKAESRTTKLVEEEDIDVRVSLKSTNNLFSAPEIESVHVFFLSAVAFLVIFFFRSDPL